jgi:hypothetical protein
MPEPLGIEDDPDYLQQGGDRGRRRVTQKTRTTRNKEEKNREVTENKETTEKKED